MEFDDLVSTVQQQEQQLSELRLPLSEVRFLPQELVAGERHCVLNPDAIAGICKRVSAPFSYVKKLNADVQARVLQHHVDNGDLGHEVVSVHIAAEEFVGFGKPDLVQLAGTEVLEAVGESISGERAETHHLELNSKGFQLDILGYRANQEVSPGDVIRAGLRITHSFVGEHATSIEAFLFRLVCSNGMVHRDCVTRRASRTRRLPVEYPHARDLQKEQIRRLTRDVWTALAEKLSAFGQLQEESVEIDQLFRRWLQRARLSTRRLLRLLETAWQAEGATPTMYGAVNAVTRVATHEQSLTDRERHILLRLAGLLAFRRLHLCPRCFSVLNTTQGPR